MRLIPLPYQLLGTLVLCVLCWIGGRWSGSADRGVVCEAEKASATAEAVQDALQGLQRARAAEHQAQAALAVAEAQLQEGRERAQKLEADVAAAIRAGTRRVQPSLCAAVTAARVPGDAAPGGGTDDGADDGSRRIGRAVAAAAACDEHVQALQQYARVCVATCGPVK